MAKVSFTTKGYIEVWWQSPAGLVFLSRHRQETEAVEALTIHAATQTGEQNYELRFPNKTVKAYGIVASQGPPPGTPSGLVAQAVTAAQVYLRWTDGGDATQWTVYRDGASLATVSAPAYTDLVVVPSHTYSYQVQASNSAGASALCTALPVTTSANSVPVWTLGSQVAFLNMGFSLNLTSYCSDPDGHSLTFALVSGSVPGLSLVGSVYSGTPSSVAAYSLTFSANDGYGTTNVSVTFTVSDPDVTAPTVPVASQATANGSTVTVSWVGSTDASGIQNYDVYRSSDGTNYSFRSLQSASPYVESGVPDGTWYYKVRARDNSTNHNVSALSNAVSVVVSLAPPAPDTPINFVATAVSSSQIDLSWAAGPNGATPTDYDLDFATAGASGPWTSISIGLVTTYSHTGRSASTQYWYRIRANNGATPSPGYATSNATTTTVGARKWNPGYYMFVHNEFNQATRLAMYAKPDFINNPNIKGACITVRWAQLESDVRGVYSGFTKTNADGNYGSGAAYGWPGGTYGIGWLQTELNYLKSIGKRLIVRVYDKHYGTTDINRPGIFPAFLKNAGYTYVTTGSEQTLSWKRWNAIGMGWFIDMMRAYGTAFDSDPYFEMIGPWQESTDNLAVLTPPYVPADFSPTDQNTQFRRLALALRESWPTTNIWMCVNWSPYDYLGSYVEYCRANKVGVGNPDTSVPYYTDAGGMTIDKITRGAIAWDVALKDYRGLMPIFGSIEQASQGWGTAGSQVGQTSQTSHDFVDNSQRVSHFMWARNVEIGTNEQRWYLSGTERPGGVLDIIGYPAGTYGGVAYSAKTGQPLTYINRPTGY